MASSELLNAQIAEYLAEDDAECYERGESVSISLLHDAELWRVWPELAPDQIPQAVDFLNEYTSVENFKKNTALHYIDNPKASRETWDGRWRQAYVRRVVQGDVTKLVQVLRKGYANSLLDEEARLDAGDNNALVPERLLRRKYVNLNYERMQAIMNGLEDTKHVESPVVDGQTYTGRWRIVSTRPSRSDDGSGIVVQTLAKNLIMTPDALPDPILLTDEKALLSPFIHDTGSEKNSYIWEYRWIDPDYAQTLRDTISLVDGVIDAKVIKSEDGSCNIQVLTQTNDWEGNLNQVWARNRTAPSFAAERIVDTFTHLDPDDIATYRTTLATADSGYKVSSIVDELDAGGGFASISRTQDKLFCATGNEWVSTTEYQIGAVCSYNDTLYRCIKDDVSTAARWSAIASYAIDELCSYDGKTWKSLKTFTYPSAWAVATTYALWQTVHYKGRVWKSTVSDNKGNEPGGVGFWTEVDHTPQDKSTWWEEVVLEANLNKIPDSEPKWWTAESREEPSPTNGVDMEDEFAVLMTDGVVRTTMWLAVPDADLSSAMKALSVPPYGYTVLRVGHNYNGTGSANIVRTMIKSGASEEEAIRVEYPGFEGEQRTYYYFGLSKAQAESLYSSLQTTCDSEYKVDSVTIIEWRGALAVVQQISKVMATSTVPATVEALGHEMSKEFEWWGDGEVVTKKWLSVKDADLDTYLALLATAPEGYTTASISHNFNGTGSADIVRVCVKQNTDGFESAIEFPTFEGERKTNIYLGLSNEDDEAQDIYETCQEPPAGYKVDSVTKQQGLRGTITVIQQISKIQSGGENGKTWTSAVRAYNYTRTFGRVTTATTVYLNVAKAKVASVKAEILEIADIIVLEMSDNDNGQGSADVTYTWRTKEVAPREVGDIAIDKPNQFAGQTLERVWIDVDMTSATALETAVGLAIAGSAPYTLAAGEQIISASGRDAGDKTAILTQRIFKKPTEYTYAEYTEMQTFNPHGLQGATQELTVREYPQVAYVNLAEQYGLLKTWINGGVAGSEKGSIRIAFDKSNGTFDMVGIKEGTPHWDNAPGGGEPDYVQTELINPGQWAEGKVEVATGVPVADAAGAVEAAAADSGYALDRISMQERGNGEAVIVKQQSKADGTIFLVKESEEVIRGDGTILHPATKTYTWLNVPSNDPGGIWGTASKNPAGIVAGYWKLHHRERVRHPNGMMDITSHVVNTSSDHGWMSNYWAWKNDTKTWIEYEHQYWRQSWRCIKITTVEYRGTSLTDATAVYNGTYELLGVPMPIPSSGDSDSIPPSEIGYNLGQIIYRTTNVHRQYSAWYDYNSTTPHAENPPHSGHGDFV